jgi:hypothetical protein
MKVLETKTVDVGAWTIHVHGKTQDGGKTNPTWECVVKGVYYPEQDHTIDPLGVLAKLVDDYAFIYIGNDILLNVQDIHKFEVITRQPHNLTFQKIGDWIGSHWKRVE